MPWYAAHIVFAQARAVDLNGKIVSEENIVLIEAASREHAKKKAKEFTYNVNSNSKQNELLSYFYPEKSVVVYSGVRKIVDISNTDLENNKRPSDGSEITYELLKFDDRSTFESFVSNRFVNASFWGDADADLSSDGA